MGKENKIGLYFNKTLLEQIWNMLELDVKNKINIVIDAGDLNISRSRAWFYILTFTFYRFYFSCA